MLNILLSQDYNITKIICNEEYIPSLNLLKFDFLVVLVTIDMINQRNSTSHSVHINILLRIGIK